MAERKESAADIAVSVGGETNLVVEQLSLTKEIDIETVYGSGQTLPDGYGINQISYQGSIEFQGNKQELEDALFNDDGIPVEFTVTVTHHNGEATDFKQCLITSEGWEMNAGEITTTSFELIAMKKEYTGGVTDKDA